MSSWHLKENAPDSKVVGLFVWGPPPGVARLSDAIWAQVVAWITASAAASRAPDQGNRALGHFTDEAVRCRGFPPKIIPESSAT